MSETGSPGPTPGEIAFDRTMTAQPGVAEAIVPGVRRVLADNPSALTFMGTNTYLIGDRELAVIDAGPDSEAHRAAILVAAGPARITHIFLTHTHKDHSAGMAKLAAATGAETCAFGPISGRDGARRAAAASHDGTRGFFASGGPPQRILRHGDVVAGNEWQLTALHTPGHAPDHLCFALDSERVLISGDHVMGWNTSVIAPPEGHMGDYMASLESLLGRDDALYLPGHGGPIHEPQRMLRAYLVHRQMREMAILECVREGLDTVSAIRERVYKSVAPAVIMAAALSVLAHLESLVERGLVTTGGSIGLDGKFRPAGADVTQLDHTGGLR